MTGWYDSLSDQEQMLARLNPAGLAVVHTAPYAEESGQRWKLYPHCRLIVERVLPKLLNGGRAMVFMPPRHGKSLFLSVYTPAWFVMANQTKNVILTSYNEQLATGFSDRARKVVEDLGHVFGVRVHPKNCGSSEWQIQYLDEGGAYRDGGFVYATGAGGSLTGRGGHLIVMDDVVKGHADTTPHLMSKAYAWYQSVLRTRLERPNPTMLLVMTRWASADIAGRILEDEPEDWDVLTLPALAKEGDPLKRRPGEALCPDRITREELEKIRDGSEEGGAIFSALYQQEPMPTDAAIFKREWLHRWKGGEQGRIHFGNKATTWDGLRMIFATIDPALKGAERNDPTGFCVWALAAPGNELLLLEDLTRRMNGTEDLLPLMRDVQGRHRGITFYVEDQAHGTEVLRACERERLPVMPLKADRDKFTRAMGAQPAFASGQVYLPAVGVDDLVRELLEFPGGRHDDRVDCVAYAVQVWRERSAVGRLPIPMPVGPEPWHQRAYDGPRYRPPGQMHVHPQDRERPRRPRHGDLGW